MKDTFIKNLIPGVWSEDFEKYPDTIEHRNNHPDLYNFIFHGYKCSIYRNGMLNWCGDITIPKTHPDYRRDSSVINIYVHGGLNYRLDDVFGFSTSNEGDIAPEVDNKYFYRPSYQMYGTYKDREYALTELERLAAQFKARENS